MKDAFRELLEEQTQHNQSAQRCCEEPLPPSWLTPLLWFAGTTIVLFTALTAAFGIFLGLFTMRHKEDFDKTAREVQDAKIVVDGILREAKKIIVNLGAMHEYAQNTVEGISKIAQQADPETATIDIDMDTGTIEIDSNAEPFIKENVEKAIAHQDNQEYKLAKEKWLDIAGATKNNTTAATAYCSAAYLTQAYDEKYKTRDKNIVNEVISLYNKALSRKPEAPAQILVNIGNAKAMLEQYQEAIEDYTKALDINPKDAKAFNNRGMAKAKLERTKDAIEDFNEALDIEGNYAEALSNRGNARAILGQYQDAIGDFDMALDEMPDTDPNKPKNLTSRGITKAMLKRYIDALRDYDEALSINEDYVIAIVNRGYTRGLLGDIQGAKEDAEKALQLDPSQEGAKQLLARIKERPEHKEQ